MSASKSPAETGLIDTFPNDTLTNVSSVLCFIQELQIAKEEMDIGPQATTGLYFILKCCTDALGHAGAAIDAEREANRKNH